MSDNRGETHPDRGSRVRRSARGHGAEAGGRRRSSRDGREPRELLPVPAVPPGGGVGHDRPAGGGRAAPAGPEALPARRRRGRARRSRGPRGPRPDVRGRRANDRLRHRGARARLAVPRPADPGSRGARDRVQDRAGSDLPPEPRARAARRRGVPGGRRATPSRAHLRLRRRGIRRRRSARRARGPRARRDRALPRPRSLRDAMGPRRRRGPHPPGAPGGPRLLRGGGTAASGDRHPARNPARVGGGRGDPVLHRRALRRGDARVDGRGEALAARARLGDARRCAGPAPGGPLPSGRRDGGRLGGR